MEGTTHTFGDALRYLWDTVIRFGMAIMIIAWLTWGHCFLFIFAEAIFREQTGQQLTYYLSVSQLIVGGTIFLLSSVIFLFGMRRNWKHAVILYASVMAIMCGLLTLQLMSHAYLRYRGAFFLFVQEMSAAYWFALCGVCLWIRWMVKRRPPKTP